eukprot:scaffold5547_cov163-Amphora_coffeaeformis.AAC.2
MAFFRHMSRLWRRQIIGIIACGPCVTGTVLLVAVGVIGMIMAIILHGDFLMSQGDLIVFSLPPVLFALGGGFDVDCRI